MASTVRAELQTKIAAAEAELATMKTTLATLEANVLPVLEHDVEAAKTWLVNLVHHLGL